METANQTPGTSARPEKLLRIDAVMALVGLRKTMIYEMTKAGEFPRPISFSRRASLWPESAIEKWIQDRIKAAANH